MYNTILLYFFTSKLLLLRVKFIHDAGDVCAYYRLDRMKEFVWVRRPRSVLDSIFSIRVCGLTCLYILVHIIYIYNIWYLNYCRLLGILYDTRQKSSTSRYTLPDLSDFLQKSSLLTLGRVYVCMYIYIYRQIVRYYGHTWRTYNINRRSNILVLSVKIRGYLLIIIYFDKKRKGEKIFFYIYIYI